MSEKYATYRVLDGCEAPNNLQDGSRLVGQIAEGAQVDRDALILLADEIMHRYVEGGCDGDEIVMSRGAAFAVAIAILDACGVGEYGR